ncbi:MAG TPA: C_GCAxxG_C_C family protein [Sulfuricurvum sp.]|nr:C_GCAxxG_C_C family protein [Sulfuricurvum sp.]
MDKKAKAVESFAQGHLCSQSILAAFCDELGLERETALKLSQGFGGGFARSGETCGAVTGALMVLGLKYGTAQKGETQEKAATYAKVNAFLEQFKARHGSITCRELLCCDISTQEGHDQAQNDGHFATVCPKLVTNAVEILESLIEER